jgi:hypothetical protein
VIKGRKYKIKFGGGGKILRVFIWKTKKDTDPRELSETS